MKRNYELVVILDPEIKEEDKKKLLAKIEKTITDADGKVLQTKDWGRKEFTYPMNKKTAGSFYWWEITASSDKVASFKQKLQVDDTILKYLLVSKEA